MKWILRPTLENKMIAVSERGLTSAQWSVYNTDTKRTRYSSEPTSDITAVTVVVDGFALLQKDTAGITSTATRSFTAGGMVFTQIDGRGNASTTVTDTAGRSLSVTDAAGNQPRVKKTCQALQLLVLRILQLRMTPLIMLKSVWTLWML
ncbi:MAG: hypothetical protein IKJ67_09640 [Bacteroidales bacterium]|nr:hypothetical protein [Bacteroidales bacterium]